MAPRGALCDRAKKEPPVPDRAHPFAAVPELKGDAAEDQAKKHQQHRKIKGAEEHRVGIRERRKQPGADHHQPGLVAIPERRDGAHHPGPFRLVPGCPKQDPNADIEAIQDHVEQDGVAQNAGPKQC
jgi:hypothetical protein